MLDNSFISPQPVPTIKSKRKSAYISENSSSSSSRPSSQRLSDLTANSSSGSRSGSERDSLSSEMAGYNYIYYNYCCH